MASIIASHNKHLLPKENQSNLTTTRKCYCRQKESYPLAGECQTEKVVYQATIEREDNAEEKAYIGITEGEFKSRYHNHTNSFRNPKHKNRTSLSIYIWNLKD